MVPGLLGRGAPGWLIAWAGKFDLRKLSYGFRSEIKDCGNTRVTLTFCHDDITTIRAERRRFVAAGASQNYAS